MLESWLPVAGFEGLYEVSDQGRIRSLGRDVWRKSRAGNLYVWRRPARIHSQYRSAGSPRSYRHYWQARLIDAGGGVHHYAVHRLVSATFLGPRPAGMQVRHGPDGKLVNALANLSYGTPKQNQKDRERDGTSNKGSRNPSARLTEVEVGQIRTRHSAGEAQKALAAEFEISRAQVSMVISGKSWRPEHALASNS